MSNKFWPEVIWVVSCPPLPFKDAINGLCVDIEVFPTRERAREHVKDLRILYPELKLRSPEKYVKRDLYNKYGPDRAELGQFVVPGILPDNIWLGEICVNDSTFWHICKEDCLSYEKEAVLYVKDR